MGQLLIHDLDEAAVAGLNRRAAENHTSAEEEARRLLERHATVDIEAVMARLQAAADMNGPVSGPSSTEILRSMRYGGDDE